MDRHLLGLAISAIIWGLFCSCNENTDTSLNSSQLKEVGQTEQACHDPDPPPPPSGDCVYYVRVDAASGGDGLSWGSAFRRVQQGIEAAYAATFSTGSCEVWVAAGSYFSHHASKKRAVRLRPHVAVYGGFAGGETERAQRDFRANPTILDGRKSAMGKPWVAHVVWGSDHAILDGFTVRKGKAHGGSSSSRDGAGLYNFRASPLIRNCTFIRNKARDDGGAVFNAYASPTFENCVFANNRARDDGGAAYNYASNPLFINCVFYNNRSKDDGGAIYGRSFSTVRVINSTFAGNRSKGYGGAVYTKCWSVSEISNSIVWGNDARHCGDEIGGWGQNDVQYSNVRGGFPGSGNIDADPLFVDASAGELHLAAESPSIDAADGDVAPEQDLDGHPRADVAGTPNTGVGIPPYVDMGAFEFQDGGDPCDGVICDTPPPDYCDGDTTLMVYDVPGTCDLGQCDYTTHTEECPFGCADGACNADPCEDVQCDTPPDNECADADNLRVYEQTGTCDQGDCLYGSNLVFCEFGCDASTGTCLADPCTGVTCTTPPANVCDDSNTLRVYETNGYCEDGDCYYNSQLLVCDFGCESGECLEDPCAGVSCNSPPANFCSDTSTLRVYQSPGTCSDGECEYSFNEIVCEFGCEAGECLQDPCLGVTCNNPPANHCADEDNLVTYADEGTCTAGVCHYEESQHFCQFGCQAGQCLEDPCLGITCNTPPANYCVDQDVLRHYDLEGVCADGVCSYTSTDDVCEFGCEAGECLENPCLGVSCDTPPAPFCRDANTAIDYLIPGTCTDGLCSYTEDEEHCPYGCENGICLPPQCTQGTCCDNGFLRPVGFECRAAAGDCDIAETCTGTSGDCPADQFEPATQVCRISAGECDLEETCTGSAAQCPTDAKSTAECRAADGPCDAAEYCDGTNTACPADELVSAGTECRARAGDCDTAEQCDGENPVCPLDGYLAAGTVCRTSAGTCDLEEVCDGTTSSCPANEIVAAGTVCRTLTGNCDVAEFCDGINTECPTDELVQAGTECRSSFGVCDVEEYCDGLNAYCPTDDLLTGVECRASAGECDLAENCDGTNYNCPVDNFKPVTTTCREAVGACDIPESCSGISAQCPVDGFMDSSQLCGTSPVETGYSCSESMCGADVIIQERYQYCSGMSSDCGMDNLVWHDWTLFEDCQEDSICEIGTELAQCTSCANGCLDGSCIGDSCVYYVNAQAAESGTGLSWNTAFTTIQEGISQASVVATNERPCEVWVARGVYHIYQDSRSNTLRLAQNVSVYGGFIGNESALEERDWRVYRAIIDGSDSADSGSKVYQVVTGSDNARLDGFTVRNGYADGTNPKFNGGGMYNRYSSPTIANCVFESNYASFGGGVYNYRNSAVFENCIFKDNSASYYGGGVYENVSSGTYTNCVFFGNAGSSYGGAVHNLNSNATFLNNTIVNNTSSRGGGIACDSSDVVIANSIIWNNSSYQIYRTGSTVNTTYSNVQGGFTGVGNIDLDPLFLDESHLNYRLSSGSPSIDAANGDMATDFDFEGAPRWDDPSVDDLGTGAPTYVDMGAYEAQSCDGVNCEDPPISYCADPNTAVVFGGSGYCDGGYCVFEAFEYTCDHGCSNGECNPPSCDAGECCENGYIADSDIVCGELPVAEEYGCSTLECGGDVVRRQQFQYCNGIDAVCGMDNLVWTSWHIAQTCYSYGYCETDSLSGWCSNCEFGCAVGECNLDLPPDPSEIAPPRKNMFSSHVLDEAEFIITGDNPIQKGVLPGTIKNKRATLVRGKVTQQNGIPLSGTTITVKDRAEFGSTVSRADGVFDMIVNGGGQLTFRFEKESYLTVQRKIQTSWDEYTRLPSVTMIQTDTVVNQINTDEIIDPMMLSASTVVDDDGSRQARLLLKPGTDASIVMRDGTKTQVGTLNLRMTEYTVGESGPDAMPGELPPTSAYTYAVEISDDFAHEIGASTVEFSKPVVFYLDNFLNFPAGTVVPVGFYDKNKASWIPYESGIVFKIVDIVNGIAEVDIDGDDSADSMPVLTSFGFSEEELTKIAQEYPINHSYWRVELSHLTPWDCNWPFGPPDDAFGPGGDGDVDSDSDSDSDGDTDVEDDCDDDIVCEIDHGPQGDECEVEGSIIHCESRSLSERIPINGTPFSLVYSTSFASSYLNIELSGDILHPDIARIDLIVNILNRKFVYSDDPSLCAGAEECNPAFAPETNKTFRFKWDGKSPFGHNVVGKALANVKIGYVYPAVYQSTFTFGGSGSSDITGSETREEVTLWYDWQGYVGSHFAETSSIGPSGINNWGIDVHHFYQSLTGTLYKGDGTARKTKGIDVPFIRRRSNFDTVYFPDGINRVMEIDEIDIDEEGNFYVYVPLWDNSAFSCILKISENGTTEMLTGTTGYHSQDWPGTVSAKDVVLHGLTEMRLGPDGNLYFCDANRNSVFKIDENGNMVIVAGNGEWQDPGFSGDRGLATLAELNGPYGLAFDKNGGIFINDRFNYRIRYVDSSGKIYTVAGNGEFASLPNSVIDGPATETPLGRFTDIDTDDHGNLFFLNHIALTPQDQNELKAIRTDGSLVTLALSDIPCGGGGDKLRLAPDGGIFIATMNSGAEGCQSIYYYSIASGVKRIAGDGSNPFWQNTDEIAFALSSGLPAFIGDIVLSKNWVQNNQLFVGHIGNTNPDGELMLSILNKNSDGFNIAFEDNFIVPALNGRDIFTFDGTGYQTKTLDSISGALIYEMEYQALDSGRFLQRIVDSYGNTTQLQRNSEGTLESIISPYGKVTNFVVENGNLTSIVHPDGEQDAFQYYQDADRLGLLSSHTDRNGSTYNYYFDQFGRLTQTRDPAGGSKLIRTTKNGIEVVTAMGNSTSYNSVTTPEGYQKNIVEFSPELSNEIISMENGTSVSIFTDNTEIETIFGTDSRWEMSVPMVKQKRHFTPNGLIRTEEFQREVNLDHPEIPYDINSLTDTMSVNGKIHTENFNSEERLWTYTSPEGRQSYSRINAEGKITDIWVLDLEPIHVSYDVRGKMESLSIGSSNDLRTYQFTYNELGLLAAVTDPLQRTTQYEYNQFERIIRKLLPDFSEILYTYDSNGNVTSITPPGKPTHGFEYTAVDLLESYLPPDLLAGLDHTHYDYNLDRQLELITRPDGVQLDYVYDTDSRRLIRVDQHEGAIVGTLLNYMYNTLTGKLETLIFDGSETLTWSFDGLLPTNEVATGTVTGTVSRVYDNDFNVTSRQINGNHSIEFTYDNDGLLESAGELDLILAPNTGLLAGTTIGNVTSTNTYNDLGEVDNETYTIDGISIFEVSYTRDLLGRIATKAETIEGETATYRYEYDPVGRLTNVFLNGDVDPISQYDYDDNGNRLVHSDYQGATPVVNNGSYDIQDRLENYGNTVDGYTTYNYTANGELASKVTAQGSTEYEYDVLGNLRTVILPNGIVLEYVADGLGRRVGRKVNGILEKGFLYKDSLNLIAELDGSGSVVSRFVYGSHFNVPDYFTSNKENGTTWITYRIISDHLGSPRLVVNTSSGAIVQRIDYDEFGRILQDTNPGFQPFGFAGGQYDEETGLVRFGARDYDAEIGRWTTKDPIGFNSTNYNLYTYGISDPVNFVDFNGKDAARILIESLVCRAPARWAWEQICKHSTPGIESHRRRNEHNRCPEVNPLIAPNACDDNRDWHVGPLSDKLRGSDGSECWYGEDGRLIEEGTYNFEPDELSTDHICKDVLPWCKWG